MSDQQRKRLLADSWYAENLSDIAVSFESLLKSQCPSWIRTPIKKIGLIRGVLLYWYGRSFDGIVTVHDHKGATQAMFLNSIFGRGRRPFILLELLCSKPMGPRLLAYQVWHNLITIPVIRRSVRGAQVMTFWEQGHYARMFGVPKERFRFIPWPLKSRTDVLTEKPTTNPPIVMSSGRVRCDWETLFRAADGAVWQLLIICSGRDLTRVNRLNRDGRANVLSEITQEEHRTHMRGATICVMCIHDRGASVGHVRLSEAVRTGTPIVVTDVKGLAGYVIDGKTAVLVPEGDPVALRKAIDELLADQKKRESVSRAAFERATEWTSEDYMLAVKGFVEESSRS